MSTSSIFHFFANLVQRRGYLIQDNDLEKFKFPNDMIAAKSSSGFPDIVLKTNRNNSSFSGGELIEVKSAKDFRVSSFNSTLPTEKKLVSTLTKKIQNTLEESGEDIDYLPERDVYYLVRGIKQTGSHPLSKTILVSGAFFETKSVSDVLSDAFSQVVTDSTSESENIKLLKGLEIKQENFASTRHVDQSAISVRFRVMAEAESGANLLNDNQYPAIEANTLTLLTHEPNLSKSLVNGKKYSWCDAPRKIKNCEGYSNLSQAYDDIDKALKQVTEVSFLKHPMNGLFFMAQTKIT